MDYIGISKKLSEALAAYRREDVASAMQDQDARSRPAHETVDLVETADRLWQSRDE